MTNGDTAMCNTGIGANLGSRGTEEDCLSSHIFINALRENCQASIVLMVVRESEFNLKECFH